MTLSCAGDDGDSDSAATLSPTGASGLATTAGMTSEDSDASSSAETVSGSDSDTGETASESDSTSTTESTTGVSSTDTEPTTTGDPTTGSTTDASTGSTGSTTDASTTEANAPLADVLSVSVRGTSFSVELQSPDVGCSNYADWWEVVTPEGELLYRRILAHSHVDEQPFTRSGGPVDVGGDDTVIVRAHMNPGGYGGQAMRGSANAGFTVDATITASFAEGLESSEPLPSGCAF
jgi:hypothetical protein